MKKTLLKISLLAVFGVLSTACNKDDDNPTPILVPSSDVFAVGKDNISSTQSFFYKNNLKTNLEVAPNELPTIKGIFVDGNDVYTIGYVTITNPPAPNANQACYWKNNVKFMLPFLAGSPVDIYSEASAITVVLGDIYITGFSATNGSTKRTIILWKNSVASNFASSPTISFTPLAISVFNNDIYIAGYTDDFTIAHATFWKNGILNTVSTSDTVAQDIKVNQSGVHVMFKEYSAGSGPNIIKYWKDGVETTISAVQNMPGKVMVNGSDVYITGGESDAGGSNYKALYWKNGVKVQLPDGNNLIANDIKVGANGDVYIASRTPFNSLAPLTYWKNNVKITLGTTNEYIVAFDINKKL